MMPNQSAATIRRVLENPEKNFARREPNLRAQMSPLQRRPAGQADGSDNLSAIVAADRRKAALRPRRSTRAFSAVVAEK
jgi:erythromycin esterase-like protein